MIEMGGFNDPLRGALVYQRSTQIKNVGSQRRVKKIVEETNWIGAGGPGQHKKMKVELVLYCVCTSYTVELVLYCV